MTRAIDLLRSGVEELRRGDPSKISRWIQDQVVDRVSKGESTTVVDESPRVPSWIETSRSLETIQHGDEYVVAFSDGFESESIVLNPDSATRVLEFPVTDIENIESFELHVTGELETGEDVDRTLSYQDGLYDKSLDKIEFCLTFDAPVRSLELVPESYETSRRDSFRWTLAKTLSDARHRLSDEPAIGLLSVRAAEDSAPPIFLISVDTLRHDHIEELQPAIDSLGDEAVIPSEPRTQGFFTTPSHATMFTGMQPGDHGHVEADPEQSPPISESHWILSEFLTEHEYRNSGLVSHTRLLPNYGFGRGFHRYELGQKKPSEWTGDAGSARVNVDKMLGWLREDLSVGSSRLFYFLHLFDPHPPFYPPNRVENLNEHDLATIEGFLEIQGMSAPDQDYLDLLEQSYDADSEQVEYVDKIYRHALRYTGEQLSRLFEEMDNEDILDDALVIVTGDHGYEMFERGFSGAKTLYDANVRQGMVVKPPVDSDWDVPDDADTLDIFQTVVEEIGATPPDQCQGEAWQNLAASGKEKRYTERIRPNWYCVAVESEGVKAIYTYDSNNPNRPTEAQIGQGPVHEEYYRIENVRDGVYEDCGDELSDDEKQSLRDSAETFISSSKAESDTDWESERPSQETEELLENLGYK